MKRREFITFLGAAATAWPLAARAQQPGKVATIGFMGPTTPSAQSAWVAAFLLRLRDLGWVEGRNITVVYRWAEGRPDRYIEIAAEFVRLKVDIIVTYGTPTAMAAKQVTSVIPIVFAISGDPVGGGLVASLGRPGANVTGLSLQTTDTATKRLQLLREIVPNLRRFTLLVAVGNPTTAFEIAEVQAAARTLGLSAAIFEVRAPEDIVAAIDGSKNSADALYVAGDTFFNANRVGINTLAVGAKLPTMYIQREFVEAGGLISYGPSFPGMFRRTAEFVDKILRGAKPADIPVEQPTKFELVVNLNTAKALGLTVPPTLRALATEVIE
jgi:putative ABC transport system substrate-binding protein